MSQRGPLCPWRFRRTGSRPHLHPILPSPDAESYRDWVAFHADGRLAEPYEYPLTRIIRDGTEHARLEPGHGRYWIEALGDVVLTGRDARFRGATSELGRVFDVHAVRIVDQAQNRVAVVFEDAAARREGEERREARDRDRTVERDLVWRTSRDLLVVCGLNGTCRAVNPAWTETFGWTASSLVGIAGFEVAPEGGPGRPSPFGG